jgi:hypothetical protein
MLRERTRLVYTEESNSRSEEMALCEIYFEAETAYECVAELGELSAVQFKDVSAQLVSSICAEAMALFTLLGNLNLAIYVYIRQYKIIPGLH